MYKGADVVELFDVFNTSHGYVPICKNKPNGYFVMGIDVSSVYGKLKSGWKLILHKRHSEIQDNEIVDINVRYVKSLPKSK